MGVLVEPWGRNGTCVKKMRRKGTDSCFSVRHPLTYFKRDSKKNDTE